MDFELKHLEMIQNDTAKDSTNSFSSSRVNPNSHHAGQSAVLEDLTGQIEELQTKLKISYRKLLLFETENQKLIQEKNAFFYENKIFAEHNSILTDKNKKLLTYNEELEEETEKKSHKIEIAEKLIEAQKIDLNRLSKFHLKVKNIIKPFVENLKTQNAELTATVEQQAKMITQLETYQADLTKNISDQASQIELNQQNYAFEKKSLIQSYEEQIHFLSKEIVEQQQKTMDANNENLRLKKQCETKHFVENELVKYKRVQDENIQTMNSLKLREAELNRQLIETQLKESNERNQVTQLAAQLDTNEQVLESTRKQLSLKISEAEQLHLRLKMLEKLNSNLSLNLKDSQNQ